MGRNEETQNDTNIKRRGEEERTGKNEIKKSDLTTLSKMSLVLGLGGLRIVVFNGFFSKDRDLKGKEKKERVRISTGKPKKKERERCIPKEDSVTWLISAAFCSERVCGIGLSV